MSAKTDRQFADTQRQFLPAALAVQESPPSPAAHWVLGLLLTLFALSVVWACVGKVDIVVTAPGRIVPQVIQAHQAAAPILTVECLARLLNIHHSLSQVDM